MVRNGRVIVTHLACLFMTAPLLAGDNYVVAATFKAQDAAQEQAALLGGWVLDTDVYPNLTPDSFAVVRGPFADQAEAARELASLSAGGDYPGAYVRDAGRSRLSGNIGSASLRPELLAALLGELSVDVADHPGAENPCEPQEPYQMVQVGYVDLTRSLDPRSGEIREEVQRRVVNVGAFWVIKRTGEIKRMRQCFE